MGGVAYWPSGSMNTPIILEIYVMLCSFEVVKA